MAQYDIINTKFIAWFSALERIGQAEYKESKNEYRFGNEAARHFCVSVDDMGRPIIGATGFAFEVFSEMDIDSFIFLKRIPFLDKFKDKVYGDYLLIHVNRITDDEDAPNVPFNVYIPADSNVVDHFYWLGRPNDPSGVSRLAGFVEVFQNYTSGQIEQITEIGEERDYPIYRDGNWKGVTERIIKQTGVDMRDTPVVSATHDDRPSDDVPDELELNEDDDFLNG